MGARLISSTLATFQTKAPSTIMLAVASTPVVRSSNGFRASLLLVPVFVPVLQLNAFSPMQWQALSQRKAMRGKAISVAAAPRRAAPKAIAARADGFIGSPTNIVSIPAKLLYERCIGAVIGRVRG